MSEPKGRSIDNSEEVNLLLKKLVSAVSQAGENLVGVRPPNQNLVPATADLFADVAKTRGRPLHYPFLGSGLGRGAYVELEDGSVKLDLINGIGINIFGHSHPRLIEASLRGSLSDVVMQGNLEPNREYYRLGRKLVDLAKRKSRLKYVWLSTCGTMANENALKSCRQKATPARKIIAMKAAFAGRSTMMAEITDNPSFREGLPEYHEVLRIPFYEKANPRSSEVALRELQNHVAKNEGDICCFTFEPIQGEGGFNVAPREYFLPLLEFCRSHKIPIWADEVQTFCRTGEFFAFEKLDIGDYIDVCTIAKTAQNGATLWTEEMNPKPGLIAGTFAGSSSALSAGYEVLRMLDEEGYMGPGGKIEKIHDEFISMLNRLNETTCRGQLQDAGGMGLMVAVTPLDGSKEKVMALLNRLFANGLIAFSCGRGPYRLRFLIPAIMTTKDINVAGEIIEKSLLEML